MPLPTEPDNYDNYVRTTCRVGQGHACCRYLTMDARGWDCVKGSQMAAYLDHRAATGQMVARGDNCPGLGAHQQQGVASGQD